MDEWLTWDQVNRATQGRLIVCFGAGNRMQRTLKYLERPVAYIVDNNKYMQGEVESGMAIKPPEVLRDELLSQIFVIITSVGFDSIIPQLESYGLERGEHFCVSPVLRDFAVISRIQDHTQTIYFTSSDPVGEGGGLYRLEIPAGRPEQIFAGHCHGAVMHSGHVYVVDDSVHGIRVLDSKLDQERIIELPRGCRPHGIATNGEELYVAYTGWDSIGCYDVASGKESKDLHLPWINVSTGLPEHHINDLCCWRDMLYVTMFSYSGNWKRGIYDGVVLQIDTRRPHKDAKVIVSNLKLPHTPTVILAATGETLHFCESLEGRVWAGTDRLVVSFNGFIRGIAYDGEFIYVGQSQHRHITRRLGAPNISLDSGIFLVDAETRCTKFYPAPDTADINTVFLLGET